MEQTEEEITKYKHPKIYKWLSENVANYRYREKYYTLTSDNKINAYCSVELHKNITQFKYHFGSVKRNFWCNECENLTSLIGSPETVDGCFDCNYCKNLTSLIGLPEKVGGYFSCFDCENLTSLKAEKLVVDGDFRCHNCDSLTSLIGLPKYIGGDIICRGPNKLTSLIGSPEKVIGDFDCSECNNLTSCIGSPKEVGGHFKCSGDKFISLIGFPEKVEKTIELFNGWGNNLNVIHLNYPKHKETYKIYLAMWLEFFESISNNEREKYITNYKDKKGDGDRPLIPIEIMKEYGF